MSLTTNIVVLRFFIPEAQQKQRLVCREMVFWHDKLFVVDSTLEEDISGEIMLLSMAERHHATYSSILSEEKNFREGWRAMFNPVLMWFGHSIMLLY